MTDHEKRIREALEVGPVQYACHADGELSQSCAFDAGQYLRDCRIAVRLSAKGQCKTDCEQWKPLNLNTSTVQVSAADLRALLADLDEARAALTAAKAGGWVAVPVDDFFVLDDDAKAMIVNSHHYTPADILALIERFRSFADPEQTDLADWDNLDWRALCNVTWRVMMGLACDLPPFATPALPDGMALVPVVPTPEMVEAARDVKRQRLVRAAAELKKGKRPDTIGMAMSVNEEWTAMLAARPLPNPPKEQA